MKLKISILSLVVMSLFSFNISAEDPNFTCDIFATVDGAGAQGSLSLSGTDPLAQKYELKVAEGTNPLKDFSGEVFLSGMVEFTDLSSEVQDAINSAMKTSRRPGLKAGPLVGYSNTKDPNDSTFTVYLMPSGEIGYLQVGFLGVLCM